MTIFNYTVNYVDVALAAIVIIAAVAGYVRGISATIIRFIRFSVGIFLCFYSSSNFTQPVYDSFVKPRLMQTINEKIVLSGNVDEIITNLNNYIESLPGFIADSLNVNSLNLSSEDIASSILTNVFEPVALKITKILIFVGVFIVFFGITSLILVLVRRHNKKKEEERGHKSALKMTDKAFGSVFGIFKAFLIVFAITSVIMYFMRNADSANSSAFWQEVQNSTLINLLDSVNPFNAITEGLI